MSPGWAGLWFWLPRVLAIAYAAFLALFALDVFEPGVPLGRALVGFIIHLLPSTLLVLAVLALAWRRPWIGALAYLALGLAYIALVRLRFGYGALALIAGPLLVLGALFSAEAHRSHG